MLTKHSLITAGNTEGAAVLAAPYFFPYLVKHLAIIAISMHKRWVIAIIPKIRGYNRGSKYTY
ncbi:hypothetical protein GNP81_10660 [Aliivibrio fischeri]|uniref:Uncharacterized protein n=1 Tax=Aliivibrio fischeri TaxID=668 RepID=A0A6I3YG59_ALIFS|nr:hypothetical protein [Aliivibrio fischeri]MUH96887.1 hypothetical protein [Aliivibrio fischeri]MUI63866.1 hypothetical protein [Aliivibrio fischeri]MUJ22290.1 hypothetical protein [Aliivibrio fischeri]MUJ24377.1 hypothetical protein [Aliivibrio fischeri]MUK26471.1 hypothetical protein [Aliivibrio fischeri]